MTVHQFEANLSNGTTVKLDTYKNNVLLVVNTASECGFTPQYEGLENVYKTYKDDGFTVLAFPCNQFGGQEPGTNEEIQQFCSANFHVSFPIFEKINVNGETAHPLYNYLKANAPGETTEIKWNFTKFLVDQSGNVFKRYESKVPPKDIEKDIKYLLTNK